MIDLVSTILTAFAKVLVCFVPPVTTDAEPDDEDDWSAQYEREMRNANRHIRKHPNDAAGYIRRASLLEEDDNFPQAMADLDRAVALDPNCMEAFVARGQLFLRYFWDDRESAYRDFEAAMRILSRTHPVRLTRLDTDAKRPSELFSEIKDATRDIRRGIDVSHSLVRRASAYYLIGELRLAQRDVNDSISADGDMVDALVLRTEISKDRDIDLLIADVRKVNRLDPTRADGLIAIARVLLERRGIDPESAVAAADHAVRIDPSAADAHFVRAEAYRKMGQMPEAMRDYRSAVKLNSNHYRAHKALAECHELQGNIPDAIAEFEEFVKTADRIFISEIIDVLAHVDALRARKK